MMARMWERKAWQLRTTSPASARRRHADGADPRILCRHRLHHALSL